MVCECVSSGGKGRVVPIFPRRFSPAVYVYHFFVLGPTKRQDIPHKSGALKGECRRRKNIRGTEHRQCYVHGGDGRRSCSSSNGGVFADGVNDHSTIFPYGRRNEPFYPHNGGGTVWSDVHCRYAHTLINVKKN